jgi:hypothetical protein
MLKAKMERSVNAHADAIADCDARKITGAERLGVIAFASTAMHVGSARGALAQAALAGGKAQTFTFAALAKAAKVRQSDVTRANLAYIKHNIDFRKALVGFTFDFDIVEEIVVVKRYSAAPKVARKSPAKPKPVASAETESA